MRLATITLYIDPAVYEDEAEEPLTPIALLALGDQVNNDAATICGYSAWDTGWTEIPD
jgi:hypothetical protein